MKYAIIGSIIMALALVLSFLLDFLFPEWEVQPDDESWVNIWTDQH